MAEWVSQREAARLLGVHISAVPKMVRRGDLVPRPGRPSLSRADVEALRDARAAAAEQRREEGPKPGPRPPDLEHTWLRAAGAAAVLGSTPVAVMARARRGRLPSTLHDGARWFALEQLELVKRAERARRLAAVK
jgi:hypothetical protein